MAGVPLPVARRERRVLVGLVAAVGVVGVRQVEVAKLLLLGRVGLLQEVPHQLVVEHGEVRTGEVVGVDLRVRRAPLVQLGDGLVVAVVGGGEDLVRGDLGVRLVLTGHPPLVLGLAVDAGQGLHGRVTAGHVDRLGHDGRGFGGELEDQDATQDPADEEGGQEEDPRLAALAGQGLGLLRRQVVRVEAGLVQRTPLEYVSRYCLGWVARDVKVSHGRRSCVSDAELGTYYHKNIKKSIPIGLPYA